MATFRGQDTPKLQLVIRDLSAGVNTRQAGNNILQNQATVLTNVDISVPGETKRRPGNDLIEDLGDNAGTGALGFEPDGGSEELLVTHGTKLEGWTGSGTFTEHKTDFTTGLRTTMIKAGESGEGDVVLISNGTDNVYHMLQAHTFQDLGDTNTSPPLTTVMTYFRNRVWALKDNFLYYSDAYPADYSAAFDRTTNAFSFPVGSEMGLVGVRDMGLVGLGKDQVYALNPSLVPAATDKPEKLLDIGCIAPKSVCLVGDDVWFFAKDGLRGVFRTQMDKLQSGTSFPLSYLLKDDYDNIRWSRIEYATGVYFDNKYFLAITTGNVDYNNEVWVFWPSQMVTVGNNIVVPAAVKISGWNVAAWAKLSISGQERLYYIDSSDGDVYRAWTNYDDEGTAITYTEEGRKEDMGMPLIKKVGGEIKIKCAAIGDYDVHVYAAFDEADYTNLGTLNLSAGIALPVDLPFTLTGSAISTDVFHLDSYGEWTTIKLKLVIDETTGNDDFKVYERQIITNPCQYYSEALT